MCTRTPASRIGCSLWCPTFLAPGNERPVLPLDASTLRHGSAVLDPAANLWHLLYTMFGPCSSSLMYTPDWTYSGVGEGQGWKQSHRDGEQEQGSRSHHFGSIELN